jgi:hypothetical protein
MKERLRPNPADAPFDVNTLRHIAKCNIGPENGSKYSGLVKDSLASAAGVACRDSDRCANLATRVGYGTRQRSKQTCRFHSKSSLISAAKSSGVPQTNRCSHALKGLASLSKPATCFV